MFNPGDTVRVRGSNVPMNTQEPPPPPGPPRPGFLGWVDSLRNNFRSNSDAMQQSGMSGPPGLGSPDPFEQAKAQRAAEWWMSKDPAPNSILDAYATPRFSGPSLDDPSIARRRGQQNQDLMSILGARPQEEESREMTFEEWLAANGGTFDSTPYDNYMNFLLQQDEETMARINAMYRELANEAEGNMKRVANVYEGAERGVGDAYDSSQNIISQAYDSSQQQAADQMARLGIEAAAPAVLNPMALSQAEALSNVATGQGAAVGATRQFGATAQDFASQMGQVAQQQGLEVSQQLLRDMKQRQAEAAFMRSQAQADFNPYQRAMQAEEARQMFGSRGQPSIEQQRLAFQMQEAMAKGQLEYNRWKRDKFIEFTTPQQVGAKPFMSPEEAQQYLDALEQLVPGF
jgi:hypothetical protein